MTLGVSVQASERSALFDNVKLVLITLVVIGHFAEPFANTHDSRLLTATFLFVYYVHIPAFVFVSGLFAKSLVDSAPFRTDKILRFATLYVALTVAFYLAYRWWLTPDTAVLSFTVQGLAPWYLLALTIYPVLALVLKRVQPLWLLPACVLLALAAGTDPAIGDFLALSRILAFLPLFMAGYFLPPARVAELTGRAWVRWGALLGTVAVAAVTYLQVDAFRPALRLVSARRGYHAAGFSDLDGAALRLLFLALAVLIGIAVIAWVPRRHSLLGGAGTRTLQVYALHYLLLQVLVDQAVPARLEDHVGRWWVLLWLAAALAMVALLSLKPLTFTVSWVDRIPYQALMRSGRRTT